jgi:hypothetical protein
MLQLADLALPRTRRMTSSTPQASSGIVMKINGLHLNAKAGLPEINAKKACVIPQLGHRRPVNFRTGQGGKRASYHLELFLLI